MADMKDFPIYERVKYLRKQELKITQEDFAVALGISRSNVGNIEVGRINITDRVIQDICEKYNVSEEWLRNGTGEMFIQTPKTILDDLKTQYNLDSMDIAIFEGYLSLAEHERETVKKYILGIAERARGERTYTREDMIAGRIAAADKKIAEEIGAKKQ